MGLCEHWAHFSVCVAVEAGPTRTTATTAGAGAGAGAKGVTVTTGAGAAAGGPGGSSPLEPPRPLWALGREATLREATLQEEGECDLRKYCFL